MLKTLGKCEKLGSDSWVMLVEYEKVFPSVTNDLQRIAQGLSVHIGDLSDSFVDAVQKLSGTFLKYMLDLLLSCRLSGCKKKVNYEPTLKKQQQLMNLVALISETLLKECDPTIQVQESVFVLVLISWYFQIVTQGKLSTTMDILLRHKCEVSETLKSVSLSFDFVLVSIGQAIAGVEVPLAKTLNKFLGILVNTVVALNAAIKDIFGLFNGVVLTVGEIARNLFKGLKVTSTSTSRTNIVTGVNL